MNLKIYIVAGILLLTFLKCKEKEPPSNYIKYKDEIYELSNGIFEIKEKREQTNIAPIAIHLFHDEVFRPANEIQFLYYDSLEKFDGTYLFRYIPIDQSFSFLKGGIGLKYDSGGEIIDGTLFRDNEETTGILTINKSEDEYIFEMSFQIHSQDTNTFSVYYSGPLNSGVVSQ